MKRLNIIIILAVWLAFGSCQGWLTVEPKDMATKDKMFSSELGFTTALTGLYLDLQNQYAPTGFLMGGSLEQMANNYMTPTSTSNEYKFYTHNYRDDEEVEATISAVFLKYYKIIANANTLIEALKSQTVLKQDLANLIEGEAYAIRAFCHFELLRLWGPVPTKVSASQLYLPYVTQVSSADYPYHTYDQYVGFMKADFDHAVELLSQSDPILEYPNSSLNTSYASISKYSDMFWYYRQKRFNVYGVKALQARLALWTGDKTTAYNLAKEVVEAKNTDGTSKFTLGTSADATAYYPDRLFFKEHLVGVDIYNFRDQAGVFNGRFASYGNNNAKINQTLFEGQTELRTSLFVQSFSFSMGAIYCTTKYLNMTDTDYNYPKSVPLIRLSELYFILIETAPLAEANAYYKTFREARNASQVTLTENNRINEVVKEYVREFYSEEQSFFVHKRLGLGSLLLSGAAMTDDKYMLPIPNDELVGAK